MVFVLIDLHLQNGSSELTCDVSELFYACLWFKHKITPSVKFTIKAPLSSIWKSTYQIKNATEPSSKADDWLEGESVAKQPLTAAHHTDIQESSAVAWHYYAPPVCRNWISAPLYIL